MGGVDSPGFALFKKLFKEGFEAARKHSDEIISTFSPSSSAFVHADMLTCFSPSKHSHRRADAAQYVLTFRRRFFRALSLTHPLFPSLDSKLDCFTLFGPLTAQHLRDRFQLGWTEKAVDDHLERLIVSSVGSNWTRLYDSVGCCLLPTRSLLSSSDGS
jgi:phosphatidylinositol kinase/protein kinase (PI-3  family)